jgi:hypothetical protein
MNEHRLITRKVSGQQHGRRIRMEPDHGHPGFEGLDRKHQLAAQAVGEMAYVARDVAAGQVEEVERPERG